MEEGEKHLPSFRCSEILFFTTLEDESSSHFIGEKTESWRSKVMYLGQHNYQKHSSDTKLVLYDFYPPRSLQHTSCTTRSSVMINPEIRI